MRYAILVVFLAATMVGCAHSPEIPTVPDIFGGDAPGTFQNTTQAVERDGPFRLWGEFNFFINAEHDCVDVVPRRDLHLHLNALKFLEEYCTNCLQVTQIQKNGDSTVDLTVRITHPFTGYPEYTGFDVKGIIMFNGSYEYILNSTKIPLPNPYYISWRELGDPELLNPDGYTPRWSPSWESGSDMPIFNYWEGKYARGVPTADLNAYLNFYSQEERHMFSTNASVTRTYHIWLPPGPVVAGYAVEACWEPPLVVPVTDPLTDFPLTANQPEAYYFRHVVNNGEVIADCDVCCGQTWEGFPPCSDLYVEVKQWGGITSDRILREWYDGAGSGGGGLEECDPPVEGRFYANHMDGCQYGNGNHRGVCFNFRFQNLMYDIAYTVFDYSVDDPNLGD